ncbi:hypothetical protein Daus18300_009692 [Diaporthe australafricana]|uniref:Bromo domain-containing protein n=1 Tax=Diaporthe australafricana TaxID=127596 RepID=A0ABR3WD76_9PEZI
MATSRDEIIDGEKLEMETRTAENDQMHKKIALMEKQIQTLTRALDSHGVELPEECANIRQELFELDRVVQEEPAGLENSAPKAGEDRQTSPDVNTNLIIHGLPDEFCPPGGASPPSGAVSTAHSEATEPDNHDDSSNKADRSHHMNNAELLDVLGALRKLECGEVFDKPITQEESPGYFQIVKEPRDLTTIEASIISEEPRFQAYDATDFFKDMRLMLDNYTRFFGLNSYEFDMAGQLEKELLKMLEGNGETGRNAKFLFDNAPRAQFDVFRENAAAHAPTEQSFEQRGNVGVSATSLPGSTAPSQHIKSEAESTDSDYEDLEQHIKSEAESTDSEYEDLEQLDQARSDRSDRTRASEDQEPAASEELPPSNRLKTSLTKQSGDDDVNEEDSGRTSKQQRAASHPVPESSQPVAPATGIARAGSQPLPTFKRSSVTGGQYEVAALSNKRVREDNVDEEEAGRPLKKQRAASYPVPDSSEPVAPTTGVVRAGSQPLPTFKRSSVAGGQDDVLALLSKRLRDDNVDEEDAGRAPKRQRASSSNKRVRDDNADEEEAGRPSKRQRAASYPVPKMSEPVAPATEVARACNQPLPSLEAASEDSLIPPSPVPEPLTPVVAAADVARPADARLLNRDAASDDSLGRPSPSPEPLTPIAAPAIAIKSESVSPLRIANRSGSPEAHEPVDSDSDAEGSEGGSVPAAAAEDAEPELAVDDLGLTDNRTITIAKLQKRAKWKKAGKKQQPNRPWVFGYQIGDKYALYIMSCPTARCGSFEIFTKHPLMRDNAADHLRDCGQVFADDDDMVRQFGTQVISDATKAVSIEWARDWNKNLMDVYGNEDRASDNL